MPSIAAGDGQGRGGGTIGPPARGIWTRHRASAAAATQDLAAGERMNRKGDITVL